MKTISGKTCCYQYLDLSIKITLIWKTVLKSALNNSPFD